MKIFFCQTNKYSQTIKKKLSQTCKESLISSFMMYEKKQKQTNKRLVKISIEFIILIYGRRLNNHIALLW